MTRLPPPEQRVLRRLNEMELGELIERYIDFYVMEDGERRSVHLPMQFVRHFLQRRDDGVLPTVVAIATLPIVLADGTMLAPDGLDRLRGILFEIQKEVRAVMPRREECTPKAVREAMRFLCDEWLCDVKADFAAKCTIVAAALTIIERSMLSDRPAFFVTAGRRGGGKTTALTMLIMAVTGIRPAASSWSSNEEERRKALLSYFLYGVSYILWDNIPRGSKISCPHIERSCTSAYYMDRKLGVSETVATAAGAIQFFNGNNIGPKGDLASRSIIIRLTVDRPDPENRTFKHPDPIGWTESHRAEILRAFYTTLLGNPELKTARDAPAKTRFKIWWRLVGSAVEHAAKLYDEKSEINFETTFVSQEKTEDEDTTSLAEVLVALEEWVKARDEKAEAEKAKGAEDPQCKPTRLKQKTEARQPGKFSASEVAHLVNNDFDDIGNLLLEFLYPDSTKGLRVTGLRVAANSVGIRLRKYVDNPVQAGNRTLVLRKHQSQEAETNKVLVYSVENTSGK